MNHLPSRPVLTLLLLCSLHSVALGEGDSKPEARKHFDRGLALVKDKAYAEAIVEFNRAYEISPHFAVLFNLGQAYVAVEQPVYAVEALRRYLQEGGKQVPKARRKQVEADIAQQGRRIATVIVRSPLDGALVRVDGAEAGRTPLADPIRVKGGSHVISASVAGYRPWEEKVDLVGGFQRTVEIRFEPASPSVAPSPVAVAPASPPPATWASTPTPLVPSQAAQTGPAPVATAPSAPTPAAPASQPTPSTTPAQAGQATAPATSTEAATTPATTQIASTPAPAPTGGGRIAAYVVGGAGLASLVVGGVFGVRAITKRHDSDAECPGNQCSAEGVRLNDQAKTAAWVSDFTIGAGLVGVAVATYLFLRSPKADGEAPRTVESGIRVLAEVGPGRAGLALGGAW